MVNNREIRNILCTIRQLKEELDELRRDCPHDNGVFTHKGNTGNYDPSCDSYWLLAECRDCGKISHIDSEKDKNLYCTIPRRMGWKRKED